MALLKDLIIENGFEGGTGGSGMMNYGITYGTPNYSSQDPSKFSASDKMVNHKDSNTESSSSAMMNQNPDGSSKVGKNANAYTVVKVNKPNTLSSDTNYDVQKSQLPINPEQDLAPKVDQIFQKKDTPSPDELMSAMQSELGKMVKKDKHIAKMEVLKNLKKDPHYYSRLNMLNIDDKKMKVDEDNSTFSKTKAVLDEMIAQNQKRVSKASTPEIDKIFKDLINKRNTPRY